MRRHVRRRPRTAPVKDALLAATNAGAAGTCAIGLARGPALVHRHRGARERGAGRAREERDDVRDLLRLDQPLDRVRGEDDLLERLLLGDARAPSPGRGSASRPAGVRT